MRFLASSGRGARTKKGCFGVGRCWFSVTFLELDLDSVPLEVFLNPASLQFFGALIGKEFIDFLFSFFSFLNVIFF